MILVEIIFWVSLAALVWTHLGYPFVLALVARFRRFPAAAPEGRLPSVVVIVAAHDEEAMIERRVKNLRELDYPPELLQVVVTSDASTDRTEELAERSGARVIRNPRRRQGRRAGPRGARDRV